MSFANCKCFATKFLTCSVFGATALSLAAKQGHVDVVKVLIENGIDVEPSFCQFEPSPLMIASAYNRESIVRILLDK